MSFNTLLNKKSSKKIVLLEMDIPIDVTWVNYGPGRWVAIITPGSQDVIDDFGNVGFYGDRNAEYKNIQSVNVGGEQYSEIASFATWETATKGWFYDTATAKLYLVIADWNPPEVFLVVAPGAAIGFSFLCSPNAYYENIYYAPDLLNVPSITKKKDPLYYGILQYNTPSFTINNIHGKYDHYSQLNLYNQPYRVFFTFEELGDDIYTQAKLVYAGKVKEFRHDFTTFTMVGKDAREDLSRQLPVNSFSNSDTSNPFYFAGLDDKIDGVPVPIAFGPIINGQAYKTSSGNWIFADTTYNAIDSGITVVDKDGVTFSHSGTGTGGTFTGADTDDKLYVTFTQSTIQNGLDIIAFCMETYENIVYNSSNFNIAEWGVEVLNTMDAGIWIGKGRLMTTADIIEQVCSDNNGIFDTLADGRYTFRTYQPDRTPSHEIHDYELLDDGSITHPSDQILSSVRVNYSEDLLEKEFRTVHNKDYEELVYAIAGGYRETKNPYKTRLTSKADAQALSVLKMEESNSIPNNIKISTKTQNINLRILDNLIYHYARQNGNEVLPRSRYQVLGITLNLSAFEIAVTIKQIESDDTIYLILDGVTPEFPAADFYDGGTPADPATLIIGGAGL